MTQLKTSLIISGDSTAAKKAVDDLTRSVDAAGASAGKVAPQARQLDAALGAVGSSATGAAQAAGALDGALDRAGGSAGTAAAASGALDRALGETSRSAHTAATSTAKLDGALDQVAVSAGAAAAAAGKLDVGLASAGKSAGAAGDALRGIGGAQDDASDAAGKLNKNIGLQRAGYQQLGYQLQDVAVQYQMGTRLSTIFAQQSGQMAGAIGLIAAASENANSKLGKFAGFIAGPYGIAIGVAVAAGSALVSMLIDAGEAATTVQFATSSLADSQSILATVMDVTTGKMKSQTEAALGLAFAQAQLNRVNAQKAAADYRSEVSGL